MLEKNNYGMDIYSQFIHLSRYSRWLPEKGRRENWEETVSRYFDFFEEHLLENNKFRLEKKDRKTLEDAVLSLEIMPSMRCLMTAGDALKRENVAGYNCLAAETMFTTKEYGHVPISSLVDKDVSVINSDGGWSKTTVRNYGFQSLMKVVVGYNTHNEEIYATPDHDWIVGEGKIKTKNLKKGDKIPLVFRKRLPVYEDIDYRLGIIHGLVYGDGTAQKHKKSRQDRNTAVATRTKGYKIRLCDDIADLGIWLDEYPKSYPESCGGDPVYYLHDGFAKTHDLKSLPEDTENESYMVGFFRGWLAADGYVSATNGDVVICVGSDEEEWLKRHMPVYGVYFKGSSPLPKTTNMSIRNKDSRNLKIWRASLTADDIIIERKKKNFRPLIIERTVRRVEKTNRVEDVFCVDVPDYHNFVIENGILTGNCAYVAIDNPRSFDEILYILMNGTGVGFSVESKYVNQLPVVAEDFHETDTTIVVADSKLGWAKALKELIHLLYGGQIPKRDTSKVRAAGAILKTFGGRASGPEPLEALFDFCIATFKDAAGRKLTTIECHDIVCKIAEIVVVGGVRRSALISLSDLFDDRMRTAKSGEWYHTELQRRLANNSYVVENKPEVGIFMKEWLALYESKSGERGIFSRIASQKKSDNGRRDPDWEFGTNPCSEIILRSGEFCNLSEVVVRPSDNLESLKRKVILATILGTFQSTLTNFKYLSKKWKNNCDEERLLGVSLTGIMDNILTNGSSGRVELMKSLEELKAIAIEVNKEWAEKLGIPQSKAVTCVKPSGTVSQLVQSSSGIHPAYAPYYIRTVRGDKKDPLTMMMMEKGFPVEDDVMSPMSTAVFSFPIKTPEDAVFRDDKSAIEQLELWLTYYRHWCEHKPSVTIYVKENEWLDVGAWVYKHLDEISGISFLPHSDHTYKQAPYQEIDQKKYEELLTKMPKDVNWSDLSKYENTDQTTSSQELACVAGGCEI